MRKSSPFALALLGLLAVSASPAVADVPPGPPPPQNVTPAPPRASAARPQIVATVRLPNLGQSVKTLGSYVPFPLPVQDGLQQLVGDFAKVINLAAPLDVVLALEPESGVRSTPQWALAFQVTSAEETRKVAKAQGLLGENRGGQTQLRLPFGKGDGLQCELTGKSSGGRMTCAATERDRDTLAPQLANLNVPGAQGKDLYAEVSFSSLLSVYSAQWQQLLDAGTLMLPQRLSIGDPQFDRAATDAIKSLLGEVALTSKDLSLLTVDMTLRPDQVQLGVGYKMNGTQSAWARADAEAAARKPSGPPPAFFALPKDVVAASYYVTDPKWSYQVVRTLLPLLDAFLAHDGLPDAERQAVRSLFEQVPKWDGLMTTVLGELATGKPAVAGDAMSMLLGNHYYLSSSERAGGSSDESAAFLRALIQTWNRPGLAAYVRKKWKTAGIKTALPILRAESVAKPLGPQAIGAFLSMDVSSLTSQFDKSGKGLKRGPLNLYVITANVGGRSWSAVGSDKNLLIAKLQQQASRPVAETLAQRSGIAQVQEPGWQSAGFTTLAGWIGMLDAILRATERSPLAKTGTQPERSGASLLSIIPHHGEIPLTYGSRGGSIGPLGLTKVMTATIPRLVIEDLIALAMNLAPKK
jgi:hypothetical protein